MYAVLDFISYGDSNPKVVREVMSALEDLHSDVEDDEEERYFCCRTRRKRKDVKSKSIWRDAV